jgi:hypothetical protein
MVKAKAVAGIALALRFAHSFGLVHGRLTTKNILFDSGHDIQIVDFNPVVPKVGESGSESDEGRQRSGFSGKNGHQRGTFRRLPRFFLSSCLVSLHRVKYPSLHFFHQHRTRLELPIMFDPHEFAIGICPHCRLM